MKTIVSIFLLAAVGALASCRGGVIERDRPVEVLVPVAQGCATDRPVPVIALRDKTPDWRQLDVRQKAALVGRQGLERQGYGEALAAATAGCPRASP